jgi:hypothetical protein
MRITRTLSAVSVWLLLCVTGARGQTVLFDTGTESNNCIPFGCPSGGRYQQLYSGSRFSSSVLVSAITVYADERRTSGFSGATYFLSLSTSSALLMGLSPMWDSNVGRDAYTVFGGFLSGVVPSSYTFQLERPFLYDPTAGNLLLDVSVSDPTTPMLYTWDAATDTEDMSRITYGGVNERIGLVTSFNVVTVTPEPLSLLLLATGLAGIGIARRKRRPRPRTPR